MYASDVTVLRETVNTMKKSKEILLDASSEVSLEDDAEKTKYMIMSRQNNAGIKTIIYWVIINPLKMSEISGIWKR